MTFTKLPVLEGGVRNGCLNCSDKPNKLTMDYSLGVGFGEAFVTKNDQPVWSEGPDDKEWPTLAKFEAMALIDPDHDWRVIMDAPLWSGEWQRQSAGEWMLIARGEGFA